MHWNRKGKGYMQMSSLQKTLKTAKTTSWLQRDLETTEKTRSCRKTNLPTKRTIKLCYSHQTKTPPAEIGSMLSTQKFVPTETAPLKSTPMIHLLRLQRTSTVRNAGICQPQRAPAPLPRCPASSHTATGHDGPGSNPGTRFSPLASFCPLYLSHPFLLPIHPWERPPALLPRRPQPGKEPQRARPAP